MNLESLFAEQLTTNWEKFVTAGLILLVLNICRLPKSKEFGEKVVKHGFRKRFQLKMALLMTMTRPRDL